MFWPLDEEWYEAVVAGFEPVTARHSLKYMSDAEVASPLDLSTPRDAQVRLPTKSLE